MRSFRNKYLISILCVAFFLVVGDCISTYLCLTTPLPEGVKVQEANLMSQWMFQYWGLVPGLMIFLAVKSISLCIIYKWAQTHHITHLFFRGTMTVTILITGYVNYNNWSIYYKLLQG